MEINLGQSMHWRLLALGISLCAMACGEAVTSTTFRFEAPESAVLRIPLLSKTPDGTEYRLAGARIELRQGETLVTRVTLGDDQQFAILPLEPGQYEVELLDGWALQQIDETGQLSNVPAVLLSPNPAEIVTTPGGTIDLALQFSTADAFGFGQPDTLAVRFEVDRDDIGIEPNLCGIGQYCLLSSALALSWGDGSLLSGQRLPFGLSFDLEVIEPPVDQAVVPIVSYGLNFNTAGLNLSTQDAAFLATKGLAAAGAFGYLEVNLDQPDSTWFAVDSAGLFIEANLGFAFDASGKPILNTTQGMLYQFTLVDFNSFEGVEARLDGGNLGPSAAVLIRR